jgi:hypothetical protein
MRNDGLFGVIKRYLKHVVAYNHAQVATAVDESCEHNRAVHGSTVTYYRLKRFLEQFWKKGSFDGISQIREMDFRAAEPGKVYYRIDSVADAEWHVRSITPRDISDQKLVDSIRAPAKVPADRRPKPLADFEIPLNEYSPMPQDRKDYIDSTLKAYYDGEGDEGAHMQVRAVAGYPSTQLVDTSLFYNALFEPAHLYVDPIQHEAPVPPPPRL